MEPLSKVCVCSFKGSPLRRRATSAFMSNAKFAKLTGTLRFCWGPEPLGTCLSRLAVPEGHWSVMGVEHPAPWSNLPVFWYGTITLCNLLDPPMLLAWTTYLVSWRIAVPSFVLCSFLLWRHWDFLVCCASFHILSMVWYDWDGTASMLAWMCMLACALGSLLPCNAMYTFGGVFDVIGI